MLWRVLLEEYKLLGVLTDEDETAISEFYKKITNDKNILKYEDAEQETFDIRQQQFDLRQQRREEVLKEIRRRVHQSAAKKFNGIYQKYDQKFSVSETNEEFTEPEARSIAQWH